ARTTTRCASVSTLLDPPPCDSTLDCDGSLCKGADLSRADESWDKRLLADRAERAGDAGVRYEPSRPTTSRVLLAAAHVQGPLPRETVLPNTRRHYSVVASGAPPCIAPGARGEPCTCTGGIPDWRICLVKADDTRGASGACDFHIDDAHRRIDDVKRICELE